MAIGGSDSALQTQLKNLYTSNLDPNIVKNTPTSLPKAKPITQMVYEGATEDNPYGTGRRISQQIDIGPDFSGLTPDRNAVGGEETVTYRKSVSPYIDAVYDDSGRLTGYEGNNNAYLTDNSYVHGSFDVNGKANPVYQTKSAGGFFQGQLPAMVALAAGAYGLPSVGDALGAGVIPAENPFLSGMAGENAISGVGVAGSTGGTYGAGVAGAGAANAITPAVTTSGTPVSQVGNGSDFINGGTAGGVSGVAATEGAGVAGSTGGSYAGGAGAAAAGVAGAGAGAAAAKTGLSDILTPSNVLIGKAILDTVGSNKTVDAIKTSAATQQAAADASRNDLLGLYTAQQGYQRPYMATGTNALGTLGSLGTGTYQMYDEKGNPTGTGTGSGYLQHQFDASDLAKGLAPNYDFMLQQGQMANQRAANMAGGGFGGNALTGLNRYTQDYAGNAYQNAFTNYQTQRQNIFGDLTKLADIGQGATNQLAKTSDVYGTNLTNLNVGNAAAQAAAQVAAAQQGGTNLSNVGNTAVAAALLNQNPSIAKVNLNV
jgi:hypothetical protein